MRVTKKVEFCYGHKLQHHVGACRNAHGHNAWLELTVEGPVDWTVGAPTEGMAVDFSVLNRALKTVLAYFDHCFIVDADDLAFLDVMRISKLDTVFTVPEPLGERFEAFGFGIVQCIGGPPTAENLAQIIFRLVQAELAEDLKVTSVRFFETSTSVAEYDGRE